MFKSFIFGCVYIQYIVYVCIFMYVLCMDVHVCMVVWAGGLAVQLCRRKCVTGGRVKVCYFQVTLGHELLTFCPGLYLPHVTLPHHDGSHLSRTMN